MKQIEIDFFWPLTEQVPLDLDYNDCDKPRITMPISNGGVGGYILTNNGNNFSTGITASNLTIDVGTTLFKVAEEPPLYRKIMYKLLNIKWEKK